MNKQSASQSQNDSVSVSHLVIQPVNQAATQSLGRPLYQ